MIYSQLLTLVIFKSLFFISTIEARSLRYIAIGDSYTIGTGVEPKMTWPSQLAKRLRNSGFSIHLVANLAKGGWTSQQAIDHELPLLADLKPDFATLQIGVNDWIQGLTGLKFKKRLVVLMDGIQKSLSNPDKLLLVNIPDFSCSPAGSHWGFGKSAINGINNFNSILKNEAVSRGLLLADIYPVSKKLCSKPGMFGNDDLHPTKEQYSFWVDRIFATALRVVKIQNKIKK